MNFPRWTIGAGLILASAAGKSLSAQVVRGELYDARTGEPNQGVVLSLIGPEGDVAVSARTLESGEFSLVAPTAGSYRVRADKPGFRRAISDSFSLAQGDTLEVSIRLTEQSVLLDSLSVSAGSDIPHRARAFYERLRAGTFGIFFTRDDVVALRPGRTTDLLRRVPGLVFTTARGDGFSTRLRGGCAPTFYIDGIKANLGGITIDDLIRPSDIEGVEIYRSVQEAPPEYQGLNAGCSAILIWTRIGSSR